MHKIIIKSLLVCSALFASYQAAAQTSKEFAMMSIKSWAAFECSTISSILKNKKEEDRLFKIGYEEGKRFLTAAQAGKIKKEDLYDEVPSGITFAMSGPTVEFILGRIYEGAITNSTKGILADSNGSLTSEDVQKSLAQNKYAQRNCKLM